MATPQSERSIQVFLNMVDYHLQFIIEFSKKKHPLFNLLKNDVLFNWSTNCKKLWPTLKCVYFGSFTSLSRLHASFYYPIRRFSLYWWSCAILGFTRWCWTSNCLMSCNLNKHKHNYIIPKHECLAVIFALKQFWAYVYGSEINIVTYHASLIGSMT